MKETITITPNDNIAVAIQESKHGQIISIYGEDIKTTERIPAKHKFALNNFNVGDTLFMYGVPVGKVVHPIMAGGLVSIKNVIQTSGTYFVSGIRYEYQPPDLSSLDNLVFEGFHREDDRWGQQIIGCSSLWFSVRTEIFRF